MSDVFAATTSRRRLSKDVPAAVSLSSTSGILQLTALLASGSELQLGPTGNGGGHRVVNNTSHASRPWEASCVEVKYTKRRDELDDIQTSMRGARRSVSIPPPPSEPRDEDGVEVVFYYETSTAEGLAGFRRIAERVLEGVLPGECRNATGQGGFATWTVQRPQFAALVRPMLKPTTPDAPSLLEALAPTPTPPPPS